MCPSTEESDNALSNSKTCILTNLFEESNSVQKMYNTMTKNYIQMYYQYTDVLRRCMYTMYYQVICKFLPSLSFRTYFCSGKFTMKSKPTREFITALMQATQSSCLRASVRELNPFSARAWSASKMAERPPYSRKPSIHFWSAVLNLFLSPEKLRPLCNRVMHSSGSAPSRLVPSKELAPSMWTNFLAFFHILQSVTIRLVWSAHGDNNSEGVLIT